MARVIVVTSGKGGVGKTTVTANLGGALANMGQKVVMLDLDMGLNNLDVVMGIDNKISYDIVDVIEGRCRIKQALCQDEIFAGLFTMPSAHSYDRSRVSGQNVRYVINRLSEVFQYILLDCPAGIELGFHRSVSAANEALVVSTPHLPSIKDAEKVISILKTYQLLSVEVVLNRTRGDLMLSNDMLDVEDIAQILRQYPIGVIPDDDEVCMFGTMGRIRNPKSEAFEAFQILADNLHNGKREIFDTTSRYKGVLGRIKRNLKRKI